ncbi:DUF1572 domain-containing protein [Lysinibacillus sphaericus]|uniref:Protein of uncharacterized function (DUF1572) n=1 Tax=Lysinibacillus sphaericus TaxID=1421 RepID=A0A2S0K1M6_LYSSH|nr:DUF1572 family protein [Lysinibacillus sphaericus]AVK97257.1 hypothetical protein LS41612_13805 [Lysinibacillus sphaericus]MED4542560.1 DUF1572 family protein [Lysinibacillus sphaericus]TKI20054.1 DUF1572 domain-containing protein [Lysinibacillus sphaericus]SUV16851.1 Protein of uncharacterised function (DUF1572) [Lysinibacillus sphaericus]GEC80344.1 hypothetical protein LSP03_00870 [Lysinibacillus sphaericus]
MSIGETYLKAVRERFKTIKADGDKAIAQLDIEQLHWAFNEESNSIAVIVKHVSGNMISRWTDFLTTDGEKTTRNRDEEFIDSIDTKEELLTIWEKGWQVFLDSLLSLTEMDLMAHVFIRGQQHTVIDAIERQMAHYAAHVGQIIYVGKQIKGKEWKTLSIPRGQSQLFTEAMKKS